MRSAKRAGFRVVLFYVGVERPIVARIRIEDRVELGGHDIPLADQQRRFARSFANIRSFVDEADTSILFDNSVFDATYRLIAGLDAGTAILQASDVPSWAAEALHGKPRRLEDANSSSSLAARLAATFSQRKSR